MRPKMTIAGISLCGLALATVACGAESGAEDPGSAASAYAQGPQSTAAELYYWDESGERYPFSAILANDNLYACLEDACIGEGYLAWMAAAWVVSVGSAWYVTNNHQRVGPFTSESSARSAIGAAARTAKKRRSYECTTTCQANGSQRGAYYVSGSSTTDCASATLAAKSNIPRGEYPRHCSCADTEGFRGTGTQCENHVRR